MKKLSYWAIMNPVKSQILLVCCHLAMALLAVYSGVLLFAQGVSIPHYVFYIGEVLFFILLVCYPIRRAKHKFWKTNYVRQKLMDAGFVLSYLLMATTITNSYAYSAWNEDVSAPFVTQIVMKENIKPIVIKEQQASVFSKKEIRKQFKSFATTMKQQAPTDNKSSGKIAGIILLMLLFMFIVAALSCAGFCSDTPAFGYLILFGGWAIVIALGVKAIRKIKGKRAGNYQPMPKEG